MPTIDFSNIDTTPGADGPFSPPLGFEGDAESYGQWLNAKHATCKAMPQYMYVFWRYRVLVGTGQGGTIRGPYAERLEEAMRRYGEWSLKKAAEKTAAA